MITAIVCIMLYLLVLVPIAARAVQSGTNVHEARKMGRFDYPSLLEHKAELLSLACRADLRSHLNYLVKRDILPSHVATYLLEASQKLVVDEESRDVNVDGQILALERSLAEARCGATCVDVADALTTYKKSVSEAMFVDVVHQSLESGGETRDINHYVPTWPTCLYPAHNESSIF